MRLVTADLTMTVVPHRNWADVAKTRMQGSPAPGSIALSYEGGLYKTLHRIAAEEGFVTLASSGLGASL